MKTTDARLYDRLRLELTEEMARVEARHGNMVANTLKGPALMIINSVVFISFLSALRSMVLMGVPSLHFGGAAWFTDLTVPDPYLGLPLLCAAVTFAQVSFNMGMSDGAPMTATTRGIKMAMQGATLLFVPFGAYVTSAVALLWVSNTGFNVLQGFVLRSPWFRRTVGLPTLDELRAMSAKVNLVTGAKPAAGAPATAAAAPGSSAAASTAVPAQPAAAALSGSSPRSPPSAFTLPSGQKLYAQPPKRGSLRGGAGSSVSRGGGGGRTYATLAAAQLLLLRHQAANAKSALIVMRQS